MMSITQDDKARSEDEGKVQIQDYTLDKGGVHPADEFDDTA